MVGRPINCQLPDSIPTTTNAQCRPTHKSKIEFVWNAVWEWFTEYKPTTKQLPGMSLMA